MPFPDTATYLWPLQDMDSGAWPSFYLRTPGYPLFWWLCRLISHDILFVVMAQSALSVISIVVGLILVRKHAPDLLLTVAAALVIFATSNAHLGWDLTLLSESVFTSTMALWAVALFLALKTGTTRFAVLTSTATAAAVYIRPASLYMVGIVGGVAIYMWALRFSRAAIGGLLAPVTIALAALVAYNAATIGVVGLSAGGTWARLWSVTVYLDPDPGLPAEINDAMAAKSAALSSSDKALIYERTEMASFRQALERNIGAGIGQIAERITGWPDRSGLRYLQHRPMLDDVVSIAIRQHPRIYLKNMVGTFKDYFSIVATRQPNFYTIYPPSNLYYEAFIRKPFYIINLAGYYEPRQPAGFRTVPGADGSLPVLADARRLTDWYGHFAAWRSRLFENGLWIWPVPLGALVGIWYARKTRGNSKEAVALVAIVAAVAGNAFACAFIGHVETRYAHPLHFVNYFIGALGFRSIFAYYARRGLRRRVEIP